MGSSRRRRHRIPFCPWDTPADGASSTALRRQTAKTSIDAADASSLRSFAPEVSMMKAAEPGTGAHCRSRRRPGLHWPSIRRVLIELCHRAAPD
jgi:hypothetical protein